jgi:autotransporter translocation and assembly factor TamB
VNGSVTVDLSLGDSVATRLLEAPLDLTIEGDSIPLAPIGEVTDAVTGIDGRAFGRMAIGGTWKEPRVSGDIGVDVNALRIASTGMVVRHVTGRLRMAGDSLTIDSLVGQAGAKYAQPGA